MPRLKASLKSLIPKATLSAYSKVRLWSDMIMTRGKSRAEIFSDIYRSNRWGGEPGTFNSGTGSRPDVTASYVEAVRKIIVSENIRTVVDIGCGDFQVGARLLTPLIKYVGCDIVPSVIERNRKLFGSDRIEFRILDAVTDPLPTGDLCLIRQVFQHLSNADIAQVLKQAKQFPFLIVTDEQVAADSSSTNLDINPYHGTRRVFGQGLKLERAPFHERVEIVLDHSPDTNESSFQTHLRTVLIRGQRFLVV